MIGDDGTISLQPGRYYLSMKAGGHPTRQVLVTISAGDNSVVNWDAGSEQSAAVTSAQLRAKTVEDLAKWRVGPAGWWTYEGSDFGWLRATRRRFAGGNLDVASMIAQSSRCYEWVRIYKYDHVSPIQRKRT